MVIDAHQHFWRFDPVEYGWIRKEMDILRRDYGPLELEAELRASGVDGAVTVQARASEAENEAMLEWAKESDRVKGVVGWLDFTSPEVGGKLAWYGDREPMMKGFRHVLQDEPDPRYMLREDFHAGISLLSGERFTYDILIREEHLPWVPEFVDRHPGQGFVLDHGGKPRIGAKGPGAEWRRGVREVARRSQVSCKISGLTTEVEEGLDWDGELLAPYWETLLEAFGAGRLLFGSDWPVCRLRTGYGQWLETVREFAAGLSEGEREAILGGNAARIYRLGGEAGGG